MICCHLYSVWKSIDEIITAEPENAAISISPADKELTRKTCEQKHQVVYSAWQTPDENSRVDYPQY